MKKTQSKTLATLVAVAGIASLVGCATIRQENARIPFPEAEYAQYKPTGDSTVSGIAVIENYNSAATRGRDPVHHFFLLPMTSYSAQAEKIAFRECHNLAAPDTRQEQYVRRLAPIANTDYDPKEFRASFEFKNVPAGKHYVVDELIYKADQSPEGGYRVRFRKIDVVAHKNLAGIEIRPPQEDHRRGGAVAAISNDVD